MRFVKTTQLASEESKLAEVTKLQKALEQSSAECAAAKVAAEVERAKYISVQGQLDRSLKEITNLKGSLTHMTEVKQENSHLKVNRLYKAKALLCLYCINYVLVFYYIPEFS